MAFPLALALGGVGLLSQFLGNQSAQKGANSAQAQQAALIAKQIELWNKRMKMADELVASGAFNEDVAIGKANALSLQEQGVDQNNAAASSRVLGYKPGDTAPLRQQEGIKERYSRQRAVDNFNLVSSLRQQKLALYDPSMGSALNPGIQAYGNQANMYRGQIAPLGPAIANLGQFLPQKKGFSLFG